MLNDRDEEHYNHEESEYHFSDEDVNYEVEPETSKPATSEPDARKPPIAGLTPVKRMGVALVVFFGLVFVVYKMVSPGTTIPSTDISPVAAATQATPVSAEPPPISHPVPTQAQADKAPQQLEVPAAAPAPSAPEAATQMAGSSAPAAVSQTPPPVSPAPAAPMPPTQIAQPTAPQPTSQPAVTQNPVNVPDTSMNPMQPAVASVPNAAANPQPVTTIVTTAPTASSPVAANNAAPANNMDGAIAAMAATNEKLMNQLQTEYTQKVIDYGNQTRLLQDQMQTLNSRVAGLELQLSQLVQALNRQAGMGASNSLNVVPAQQPAPQMVEPRVTYNVQAIIPGRAWLKSDNGDTLTVAEGDMIKELGRVTKIDPYDGVVEVNTGNKIVSISYGNNG